jgi:hypothetical protein
LSRRSPWNDATSVVLESPGRELELSHGDDASTDPRVGESLVCLAAGRRERIRNDQIEGFPRGGVCRERNRIDKSSS